MSKDRTRDTPAPGSGVPSEASSRTEIDLFLDRVKSLGPVAPAGHRGRLIFALDATMSRQPTWDTACRLQADMFREAASIGGLDIQLVYYRGLAECQASSWLTQQERLGKLMSRIECRPRPRSAKFWHMHAARTKAVRSRFSSSSATPWRNRWTICAQPRVNSGYATSAPSCSRRVTT
jgi:hypothetical protein